MIVPDRKSSNYSTSFFDVILNNKIHASRVLKSKLSKSLKLVCRAITRFYYYRKVNKSGECYSVQV